MNAQARPLIFALCIDLAWGEPSNRWHPVAWMGKLIACLQRYAPRQSPPAELAYGAGLVLLGSVLCALLGWMVRWVPSPFKRLAEAFLLKSTFSLRGLNQAAKEVQAALEQGNLPEARRLVSWHLVSRETSTLSQSQVAAAAIESVAENTSDGVVAPLCSYALGGLPMTLMYRFVNTADAMLGYRDADHEWLGKFPARLDDMLNFLPGRLIGLLFVLAAQALFESGVSAWRIMCRDASSTQSPNAGYPVSAMAGALGVVLEKGGHYQLGSGGRQPQSDDIERACRLMKAAATLVVAALIFLTARKKK